MGAQTFGKGSVQTILPLGNNAGLKLTTARYYTPAGRSIQAKGIEPDIAVDDGRESPNRIKEANLERHLETVKIGNQGGDAALDARTNAVKTPSPAVPGKKDSTPPVQADPTIPRIELGGDDDFQLKQALNQLKGLPVIASAKAVQATATQTKP
jgi:carboxyl-terminal processing protease